MKPIRIASVVLSVGLSACVSTQVMPLAPNMVRIDTKASGLLYQGRAVPETMIAAARETLARGYTHFRFGDASMGQGSEITGVSGFGAGNATAYGNSLNMNSYGTATVNRVNTEGAAVTVTMFNADEPGAKGAFVAQQVLNQYQPKG